MFKELCASEIKKIDGVKYLILGTVQAGGADVKNYYLGCKVNDDMPAVVHFIEEKVEKESIFSGRIESKKGE